jgi:KTSC domain
MMKWMEVDSTSLSAIGYDTLKSELGIRFRESGRTYFYLDVPQREYQAFMTARSKGTYLNQVFKMNGYKYREADAADGLA